MKKVLTTCLVLITLPAVAIERKSCDDPVFTIQKGNEKMRLVPSRKSCICTDKGIFCSQNNQPIPNTNIVANCKELGGSYNQRFCRLFADDETTPLFFKKRGMNND